MKRLSRVIFTQVIFFILIAFASCNPQLARHDLKTGHSDPLSSWNEGASKQAIIEFVTVATDSASESFIPQTERIAVFDNDGTLWSEQPAYFQFYFIMDRVKQLLPDHPDWTEKQPFKAVLEGDMDGVIKSGAGALLTLTLVPDTAMNSVEFEQIVKNWIDTARHPQTGKLLKEMVYQPMLEVLDYLRANGFKTYIVSGGNIDLMRPWTEEVYGIPPEQVIGSSVISRFEIADGIPEIIRKSEMEFFNDRENKPVAIDKFIGRRPVAAFGNSDGDLQMLQWTAAGEGKRLMVYIHHNDAGREWAYDRVSHVGRLDKGLDVAIKKGWTVVNMKEEWKRIYP